MSQLRNFEISIWTLQDDFITIIESAWIKTKGKTQNASMNLNIDGTQQLTFSVPMYYYMNGQKISNPAWITFSENKVLLNTRKVKVILNKQTDDEEIYEFVIDKVTETHEHDELICNIECSGLAFYELGKIGYKVSLSEDDFYNDDYSWFSGEKDSDGNLLFEEQPIANIQYWLNKFLKPYSEENFSSAQWYYKIQMNWDLTADFSKFKKDSNKIYENDIYGDTYLPSQEKYRMVNLEESNFYNLTQNIAETFGVYCKYVYSYDENYHIIGRTIIFYNNFLNEEKLSINYRGNTQSISRELDTTDLITKMYVKSVDNSGEVISIIDVDENDMGEDYLLNFDYLYSIGSIDDESYNSIKPYKQNLKVINTQLKNVSERIISIESKLPEVRARLSLAQDSIQLDKEKINSSNKLLMNLTNGTNVISITDKNPDTAVLLPDSTATTSLGNAPYYIKITRQGVDFSTIHIYKTFSLSSGKYSLSDEIKTGIPIYDEANNLVKINNIYWSNDDEESKRSKIVYLIYDYTPSMYYTNVINAWQNKLNQDEEEVEKSSKELEKLETDLEKAILQQKSLLAEKKELNDNFEKIMGPAIREGYWQPEDYSEYSQTFVSSYNISKDSEGTSHHDSFVWDNELFDGEQKIYYEQGIDKIKTYYPCIKLLVYPHTSLEDSTIWDKIYNDLDSLNFIFYDTENSEQYNSTTLRTLSFGSGAKIVFLKKNDKVAPYLILPGLESYSSKSIDYAKANGVIGFIQYIPGGYSISGRGDDVNGISINKNWWVSLDDTYEIVYPRIRVESSSLKTDTNTLVIKDNGEKILSQYIDFYINNRVEESRYLENDDGTNPLAMTYYITIKPEVIAETVKLAGHILEIMFQLSNYGTAIYKDAIEVLKDNSKPKVSYESTIDIFNKNVIKRPSYFLSKLVKINDYDLLLDEAWGYVSGVTLDLDHPENDSIEIQNYTNKFEDLFTTIVAQTEEMKRTSYIVNSLSNSFAPDGTLSANTLKNSLSKVDLNYAFNNGTLNIDEANGIWGISDSGVVAFRGGGIFTATERDQRNNWIWNTGITPEGINADLITTGQLDTNKIRVFAGDRERFQLNGEGLYAYKSFISDFDVFNFSSSEYADLRNEIDKNNTLDPAQFVRFDENGLFLVAKEGAYVLNEKRDNYVIITDTWKDSDDNIHYRLDADKELKRVSLSWDGLTLRNLEGERVFYANADTGDLRMKGSVYANAFYVITGDEDDVSPGTAIQLYVRDESMTELMTELRNNDKTGARIKDYINAMATSMGGRYMKTLSDAEQKFTSGSSFPLDANIGDYFQNTSTGKSYLRISDTGDDSIDWEDLNIDEASNASMVIDNIGGFIKLRSTKSISLTAVNSSTNNIESVLNVSINGITLASNKEITLNSQSKINVLSQGAIDIASGGRLSAVGSEFYIAGVDKKTFNDPETDKKSLSYIHGYLAPSVLDEGIYHLDIGSDNLRIMANGSLTMESGGKIDMKAGSSIEMLAGENSGVTMSSDGINILTNAYLNIAASSLKIGSTGAFQSLDSYTNSLIEEATRTVKIEYRRSSSSNWTTVFPAGEFGPLYAKITISLSSTNVHTEDNFGYYNSTRVLKSAEIYLSSGNDNLSKRDIINNFDDITWVNNITKIDDSKKYLYYLLRIILESDSYEYTNDYYDIYAGSIEINNLATQDDIFNRLTNNGAAKGLNLTSDGNLYINADYIRTGILKVGGTYNGNGRIEVYSANSSSDPIGRWDKDGFTVGKVSSGNYLKYTTSTGLLDLRGSFSIGGKSESGGNITLYDTKGYKVGFWDGTGLTIGDTKESYINITSDGYIKSVTPQREMIIGDGVIDTHEGEYIGGISYGSFNDVEHALVLTGDRLVVNTTGTTDEAIMYFYSKTNISFSSNKLFLIDAGNEIKLTSDYIDIFSTVGLQITCNDTLTIQSGKELTLNVGTLRFAANEIISQDYAGWTGTIGMIYKLYGSINTTLWAYAQNIEFKNGIMVSSGEPYYLDLR